MTWQNFRLLFERFFAHSTPFFALTQIEAELNGARFEWETSASILNEASGDAGSKTELVDALRSSYDERCAKLIDQHQAASAKWPLLGQCDQMQRTQVRVERASAAAVNAGGSPPPLSAASAPCIVVELIALSCALRAERIATALCQHVAQVFELYASDSALGILGADVLEELLSYVPPVLLRSCATKAMQTWYSTTPRARAARSFRSASPPPAVEEAPASAALSIMATNFVAAEMTSEPYLATPRGYDSPSRFASARGPGVAALGAPTPAPSSAALANGDGGIPLSPIEARAAVEAQLRRNGRNNANPFPATSSSSHHANKTPHPYVIDDGEHGGFSANANANANGPPSPMRGMYFGGSRGRGSGSSARASSAGATLGVATLNELLAGYGRALGESVAPLNTLASHSAHFRALLDDDLEACVHSRGGGAASSSSSSRSDAARRRKPPAPVASSDAARCDAIFERALRTVGVPARFHRALFEGGAQAAANRGAMTSDPTALGLAHRVLRQLHARGVTLSELFAQRGGTSSRMPPFVHRTTFLRSLASAGVQMTDAESDVLLGLLEQRSDGSVDWAEFEARYGAGDLHLSSAPSAAAGWTTSKQQHPRGASPPPPLPSLLGSPSRFGHRGLGGESDAAEEGNASSYLDELPEEGVLPKRLSLSALVVIVARSAAAIADEYGGVAANAAPTGSRTTARARTAARKRSFTRKVTPLRSSSRFETPMPSVSARESTPRVWK